jgi:hypothetical protein
MTLPLPRCQIVLVGFVCRHISKILREYGDTNVRMKTRLRILIPEETGYNTELFLTGHDIHTESGHILPMRILGTYLACRLKSNDNSHTDYHLGTWLSIMEDVSV